uniref:CRAL-TRIO domain-containing protein n=1 Tax=Syphacia muris TaxID=451379 RepID=A0A0N5AVW2_9BILA
MRQTQISNEDREKIHQLRELVKDNLMEYYDTDFNFLRWLQGHGEQPIEKIADKLNVHLKARSSLVKLEELPEHMKEYPVYQYWPFGLTDLSKTIDNCLINVESVGLTDFWAVMQSYSLTEILKSRISYLEELFKRVMELEKQTKRQAWVIFILDLSHLKYNKHLYHLIVGPLKSLSEFMADHYVELVKYFVIVNAPAIFSALWYTASPILPERTKEKIRILGSNWRKEILKYAVPESLPSSWNLEHENFYRFCLPTPLKLTENDYYNKKAGAPDGSKTLSVNAGKFSFLTAKLNSGDTLHWWLMADGSFGFGIFKTDDENNEDITTMKWAYPHLGEMPGPLWVPIDEQLTIKEAGIYKIYFSNLKAWWHTLTVTYRISITPADDANATTLL